MVVDDDISLQGDVLKATVLDEVWMMWWMIILNPYLPNV